MPEAQSALEVARDFVRRINGADPGAIASLMSADHTFVDATGAAYSGRDQMRKGWEQYFAAFPDYRIEIQEDWAEGSRVALFGWASGTKSGGGGSFRVPAAWSALVHDGRVARWAVYCDVEPMFRAMGVNRF
jgi:ketosteroid isomerase-like protein